jgi:tetratricopeptide (TPR) repeat protein
LGLAGALHWFWFVRGHSTEGRSWLEQALAQANANTLISEALPPNVEARARYGAGLLALFQGDLATARSHLETSAALCRSEDGHAAQLILNETLAFLVVTYLWQSDWAAVNQTIPEYDALVRFLDEPWANAFWAFNKGRAQLHHHQNALAAQAYLRQAQALFHTLGDVRYLPQVLMDLGTIALDIGDAQAARQHFTEALAAVRLLKARGLEANALNNLGDVARFVGDDAAAAQHYTASLRLHRDLDSKTEIPRLLHNLGYIALHTGDTALARTRFVESLLGFRAIGHRRGVAEPIAGLACLQAHLQTADGALRAARLWGAADAIYTTERTPVWPTDRAEHIRYQALARETVGSSAFDAAYAEGATLNFEQAITTALAM